MRKSCKWVFDPADSGISIDATPGAFLCHCNSAKLRVPNRLANTIGSSEWKATGLVGVTICPVTSRLAKVAARQARMNANVKRGVSGPPLDRTCHGEVQKSLVFLW